MIVPEKVDSLLTRYASRSYYDDLLDVGVEIYLYRGGLLHTKSIMVDGAMSMFGTVNLDMRSLWLNYEVALFVYEPSSRKTCGRCSRPTSTTPTGSTPRRGRPDLRGAFPREHVSPGEPAPVDSTGPWPRTRSTCRMPRPNATTTRSITTMSTTTMSRFAVMRSLLVATTCLAAPAAGQDTRSSANPSAIAVTRSRWIG